MNGPPRNDEGPATPSSRDGETSPSNINLTPDSLQDVASAVKTVAVATNTTTAPNSALDDAKPVRPLAKMTFRWEPHPEDDQIFMVSVPTYGPTCDTHYMVHAVLCEGSLDPAPAFSVIRTLWPRRLLKPNCHLIAAYADGLVVIGMDACAETVAEYAASVARLAWSFPCRVGVVPLAPGDVNFACRIGCGQYPQDDDASQGAV